jgi:hypothetical protein
MQTVAGSVGLASLLGALFQLVRDSTAHERAVWLKRDEQRFALGVTSHMADIVFDKHIAFCEEYIVKVQEIVTALFQDGPTERALNWAGALHEIRRKHITWIPRRIDAELEAFEFVLRQIGADAHYLDAVRGGGAAAGEYQFAGAAERFRQRTDLMFQRFQQVLAHIFNVREQPGDNEAAKNAAKNASAMETIEVVRNVLEVERLVELRGKLVRRAHAGLNEDQGSPLPH